MNHLTDGPPPNDRGCRACGKIGHLVRDCPRKKYSDDKKKAFKTEKQTARQRTISERASAQQQLLQKQHEQRQQLQQQQQQQQQLPPQKKGKLGQGERARLKAEAAAALAKPVAVKEPCGAVLASETLAETPSKKKDRKPSPRKEFKEGKKGYATVSENEKVNVPVSGLSKVEPKQMDYAGAKDTGARAAMVPLSSERPSSSTVLDTRAMATSRKDGCQPFDPKSAQLSANLKLDSDLQSLVRSYVAQNVRGVVGVRRRGSDTTVSSNTGKSDNLNAKKKKKLKHEAKNKEKNQRRKARKDKSKNSSFKEKGGGGESEDVAKEHNNNNSMRSGASAGARKFKDRRAARESPGSGLRPHQPQLGRV